MSSVNNQIQTDPFRTNLEATPVGNGPSIKTMSNSVSSVGKYNSVRSMVSQNHKKRAIGVSLSERIAFFEKAAEGSTNTTSNESAASSAQATNNVPQKDRAE